MNTIALITKTPIISQIFTLVCKKLNLVLTIKEENDINQHYDLIILDEEFINEHFNLIKQYATKLGSITNEELSFEKSNDFTIPRPFLPMQLQTKIQNVLNDIYQEKLEESRHNHHQHYSEKEHLGPAIDYLESLASDIAEDIEDESDESIISIPKMDTAGGVLDNEELLKIHDILQNNNYETAQKPSHDEELNEQDWSNLSDIIDKAITDIQEYEFDSNENAPIRLILNKYNMEEVKPLLEKLDQNIIDNLTNGNEVQLSLKLNN